MASTILVSNATASIRDAKSSYYRTGFDTSMKPLMAVKSPGASKEYSAVSKLKSAEKYTEAAISAGLSKVAGYTDTISGYVDTYLTKTSIVQGLSQKKADLSGDILRSPDGTYSYLVDKATGNVSTWEWDGIKVQVPSTIVKPLEAVQSIVTTVKAFITFIKSALETLKNLIVGLTDIMKLVVDTAVAALNSILDIFRIDASIHLLAVPPIVPKFNNNKIDAQYTTATKIAKSASDACSIVSDFYSVNGIAPTTEIAAGNKGLHAKLLSKINDAADSNRPLFDSTDFIAGGFILLGGGLDYVLDIYRKLAEIFSVPSKKEIDYLPKAKTILQVEISINNSRLFMYYKDYTHDMSKVKYSPRYKVKHEASVIIIRTTSNNDKEYSEVIEAISSNAKFLVEGFSESNVGSTDSTYFTTIMAKVSSYSSKGVWVIPVNSSDITKSVYQGQISSKLSGIPDSKKLTVYLHTTYVYTDSSNASDGFKSLTTMSLSSFVTSNFSENPFIDYGKGKSVGWVRVGAVYDLIPALGYLREVVKLVSTFLKSFLSDIGTALDSIIKSLSDYLDYINAVLTRINTFIDLLKSLAGIGAGAAISVFHGYGGNDLLKLMLKDMLITSPTKANSSSSGVGHSSLISGTKTFFGPKETTAGILLVAGSEQLDSVINMVNLLKMLFTSDSRNSEGYTEASGISQTIGVMPTKGIISPEIPGSSLGIVKGIPGGYTESLLPATTPSDMQEDYCNN